MLHIFKRREPAVTREGLHGYMLCRRFEGYTEGNIETAMHALILEQDAKGRTLTYAEVTSILDVHFGTREVNL